MKRINLMLLVGLVSILTSCNKDSDKTEEPKEAYVLVKSTTCSAWLRPTYYGPMTIESEPKTILLTVSEKYLLESQYPKSVEKPAEFIFYDWKECVTTIELIKQ
jgi:hypothetical protein